MGLFLRSACIPSVGTVTRSRRPSAFSVGQLTTAVPSLDQLHHTLSGLLAETWYRRRRGYFARARSVLFLRSACIPSAGTVTRSRRPSAFSVGQLTTAVPSLDQLHHTLSGLLAETWYQQ